MIVSSVPINLISVQSPIQDSIPQLTLPTGTSWLPKEQPAQQALPAQQARKVHQATRAQLAPLALKVQKAIPVLKVHKGFKVFKGQRAQPVQPDPQALIQPFLDHKVHKARLAQPDPLAQLAQLDQAVHKVNREFL